MSFADIGVVVFWLLINHFTLVFDSQKCSQNFFSL